MEKFLCHLQSYKHLVVQKSHLEAKKVVLSRLSFFQEDFWNPSLNVPWIVCWVQLSMFRVFGKFSDFKVSSKMLQTFQFTFGQSIASCNNFALSIPFTDVSRLEYKFFEYKFSTLKKLGITFCFYLVLLLISKC